MASPASAAGRVRVFFGAALPASAHVTLLDVQANIQRRSAGSRALPRFMAAAQWHVTLKFVGGIVEADVSKFAAIVEHEALCTPIIETQFVQLTGFPNVRRCRVVVAELADHDGSWTDLARRIENATEQLGVAREARVFRPHVTLARLKVPLPIGGWLTDAELDRSSFSVSELNLYRSIPEPAGSRYVALASASFAGAAAEISLHGASKKL
jgi:2'-5' RNA ligase